MTDAEPDTFANLMELIDRLRMDVASAQSRATTAERQRTEATERAEKAEAERDRYREALATTAGMHLTAQNHAVDLAGAILDIDAHATPLGADADGFVDTGYIISVGCLHRALGLIGHTGRAALAALEEGTKNADG